MGSYFYCEIRDFCAVLMSPMWHVVECEAVFKKDYYFLFYGSVVPLTEF